MSLLDLSSFNTVFLYFMDNMFEGYIYLEYINMKNFRLTNLHCYNNMFKGIPDNVVVYINPNNDKIISKLLNTQYYKTYYSNDRIIILKKIIDGTTNCINDCSYDQPHQYEYNGKFYENCPKGVM